MWKPFIWRALHKHHISSAIMEMLFWLIPVEMLMYILTESSMSYFSSTAELMNALQVIANQIKGCSRNSCAGWFCVGSCWAQPPRGDNRICQWSCGAKYAHYPVIDGEVLALSEKYVFMALSTPGHTLGCITWLLVDRMRDNLPVMVTILWAPCVNLTCLRHSPEILFLLALLVDLISWEVWAIRKRIWLPCYSTVCTTSSFACQMTVLFIPRTVRDHHVDRVWVPICLPQLGVNVSQMQPCRWGTGTNLSPSSSSVPVQWQAVLREVPHCFCTTTVGLAIIYCNNWF
jgi:hypothetical protein